jgi:hypothetical protein
MEEDQVRGCAFGCLWNGARLEPRAIDRLDGRDAVGVVMDDDSVIGDDGILGWMLLLPPVA